MPQKAKENQSTSTRQKVLTVVGIVLCVILIPILIVNITLIIKSYTSADEVPSIGGYAPLIVLTGSMEPQIMEGDLIIVKQIDPKEVKKKDVIAFFDPDGNGTSILTHRVEEVLDEDGALSFRTKGDANLSADRTAVKAEKLVGIYTNKRIPGAGKVAMFMQTTAGLIVCVIVPLVLLVGWDILRRRLYEKKNRQDTDSLLAELEALKAAKADAAKADATKANVAVATEEKTALPSAAKADAAKPAASDKAESGAAPEASGRPRPMRARRDMGQGAGAAPGAKPPAKTPDGDPADPEN